MATEFHLLAEGVKVVMFYKKIKGRNRTTEKKTKEQLKDNSYYLNDSCEEFQCKRDTKWCMALTLAFRRKFFAIGKILFLLILNSCIFFSKVLTSLDQEN